MAIKSMTGFGEGVATASGIRVTVELSSVNRKQLDINISLPRNLVTLDAQVQRLVRASFSRGRVSGIVRVDSVDGSGSSVRIDQELVAQFVVQLRSSAAKLKLPSDFGIDAITRLPGAVVVEQADIEAGRIADLLESAMQKALAGLDRMRKAEGRALGKDLRDRIAMLEDFVKSIAKFAPAVAADYRQKLVQRLEEAGLEGLAADERVIKEVALFADKCDISEELTRLRSHLAQTRKLLQSAEPVGRTLDFLCQELFREINTVGSKANEIEITRLVVAFKTELERIREQVQNVE